MLTAQFQSKNPHNTFFLQFMGKPSPQLVEDLKAKQWINPCPHERILPPSFQAVGSGLFQSWTAQEKKIHTSTAKAILKKHGVKLLPHKKLTLADML